MEKHKSDNKNKDAKKSTDKNPQLKEQKTSGQKAKSSK